MGLGAIRDDVVFDHVGAAALAGAFRATAGLLDSQRHHRDAAAVAARELWRGRFAEDFDARMRVCRTDALRLAAAMRQAADGLDALAAAARQEQARREAARAWQRQQDERNALQKVGDALHGIAFGTDLPPAPPPQDPVRCRVGDDALVAASRADH